MSIDTGSFKYFNENSRPAIYMFSTSSGPDVDTGSFKYWKNSPRPVEDFYSIEYISYFADIYIQGIDIGYESDISLYYIKDKCYSADIFITDFNLKPDAPIGVGIEAPNIPGGGAIKAPDVPNGGVIEAPEAPHGLHLTGARNEDD